MKNRLFFPDATWLVRGLLAAALVAAGASPALTAERSGEGWSRPGKEFLLAAVDPKTAATQAAAAPATQPVPPATPALPESRESVVLDQTQPFSNFPDIYRRKARDFDAEKNFRRALWQWEIVLAFDPSDAEAGRRAREIKAKRQKLAKANFDKALALKEAGKAWPAFKAFARTLAYDPTNQEALQNVKVDLNSKEFVHYTVQEGDTLEEIAKRELKDAAKSFLIPYFNRLGPGNAIAVGATLRLPVLVSIVREKVAEELQASAEIPPEPKVDPRLEAIRAMMENNQVEEAARAAEEIVNVEPNNAEAQRLANESYYRLGKVLGEGEKYAEAMGMFNRVKPDYRDVQQIISNLSGTMIEKADTAYIAGIKFFVDEELDQAIGQWERSLVLNPDHPKARQDLERAKRLRAQLQGN